MNITKIIIPAAGIGSRFLPITKSIPKEMLPLSNKPAIQYIVQEAVDAGINDIGIILSPEKNVIKEYFQPNKHLDHMLQAKNKYHYVQDLNILLQKADFSFFYQNNAAGLADALMQAKSMIDPHTFFAVALPDDIIAGQTPEIGNLCKIAYQQKGMVIAVQEVPQEKISSYGIVATSKTISDTCFKITSLVEKPTPEKAPSNLAIVGRYVFSSDLFQWIPQTPVQQPFGEILLPETINCMIKQGYPVYAHKIQGKRFDTGTPQGWLTSILHHNDIK